LPSNPPASKAAALLVSRVEAPSVNALEVSKPSKLAGKKSDINLVEG
jgi:hypothetical protein